MTRRVSIPTIDQVHTAITAVAERTGRRPSAVAGAKHLGLTNTTFWRHFPDQAAAIAEQRRRQHTTNTAPTAYEKLRAEISAVRRGNQELTDQLATAIAQIQRLSVQNHRLRQELEAAAGVTRLPRHR
jgi:hypothetical protein